MTKLSSKLQNIKILNFSRCINLLILFVIISSIFLNASLFFGYANKLPGVIFSFFLTYFIDYFYLRKKDFFIFKVALKKKDYVYILLILSTAIFFRIDPYEMSYGGQDQGIYTNMSKYYQDNSNLFIESPHLSSKNSDVKELFDNTYDDSLFSKSQYLPGVHVHEKGVFIFQFYHLHPLWMSVFGKLFGDANSSYSLLLFSLLSIFTMSALVFLITDSRLSAYLSAFLFSVHPLHSFFTKWPVTEIVALFFLFNGLLFLAFSIKGNSRNENMYYLIISALSFLCLFFTRITGFTYLPFFLIITLIGVLYNNKYKILNINVYIWYSLIIFLFYFLSYFYGLYSTNKYATDIYTKFQEIKIFEISSLYIFFGLNIFVLTVLLFVPYLKKTKNSLAFFIFQSRFILFKIFYIIFLILFFLLLFKSIYIGFFETYHYHLSRWSYPQSGFKAILASDFVNIIIYSSPLIFLLLNYFIIKVKSIDITKSQLIYILPLLILLTIIIGFRVLGQTGVVAYQFYYLRYLLLEIIPLLIILFFIFLFLFKEKSYSTGYKVLLQKNTFITISLIISAVLFTYISKVHLGTNIGKEWNKDIRGLQAQVLDDQIIYLKSDNKNGKGIQNSTQFMFYNQFNLLSLNIDSFCNELPTITKISQENKLWIFTDHFGSFIKDPTILSSNEIRTRDSTFIPHKKTKTTRKLFVGLFKNLDAKKLCIGKELSLHTNYNEFMSNKILTNLFKKGWYRPEPNLVWSKQIAELLIDPSLFADNHHPREVTIIFDVFVHKVNNKANFLKISSCSGENQRTISKLKNQKNSITIKLERLKKCSIVFNLKYLDSPYNLGMSGDSRNLGIAIRSLLFK